MLEAAGNKAVALATQSKVYLNTLINDQAVIEKNLTANEAWIAKIQRLRPGPEAAKAIYVFWLKLLPKQWSMANEDLVKRIELPRTHCQPRCVTFPPLKCPAPVRPRRS